MRFNRCLNSHTLAHPSARCRSSLPRCFPLRVRFGNLPPPYTSFVNAKQACRAHQRQSHTQNTSFSPRISPSLVVSLCRVIDRGDTRPVLPHRLYETSVVDGVAEEMETHPVRGHAHATPSCARQQYLTQAFSLMHQVRRLRLCRLAGSPTATPTPPRTTHSRPCQQLTSADLTVIPTSLMHHAHAHRVHPAPGESAVHEELGKQHALPDVDSSVSHVPSSSQRPALHPSHTACRLLSSTLQILADCSSLDAMHADGEGHEFIASTSRLHVALASSPSPYHHTTCKAPVVPSPHTYSPGQCKRMRFRRIHACEDGRCLYASPCNQTLASRPQSAT